MNLATDFYKEILEQDKDIRNALDVYSSNITASLEKTGLDDAAVHKYVEAASLTFIGSLVGVLMTRNGNIARMSANYGLGITQNFLEGTLGASEAIKFGQDVENYPAQVQNRLLTRKNPQDNGTLTDRMAWVKAGAVRTVQNIVAVGVAEGSSVAEVAKNIEAYINPAAVKGYIGPWDWARRKFGYNKADSITNIPKGSVSYNAHLIARTEGSLTLRQSQIDMYGDKPWVMGFDWLLSPRHPIPDICDEWAKGSPYKADNLPKDHPNGLCMVVRRLMSKEEFNNYLETGEVPKLKYGDPDKIEQYYNSATAKEIKAAVKEGKLWDGFKPSKGLNEKELKLERKNAEYAYKKYKTIKKKYLKSNATFNPDGSIKQVILNTDEWRGFLIGYRGTNAHTNHQAASWANKKLTKEMLDEQRGKGNNRVGILAGGGGSGKGTAAKKLLAKKDYPIIIDGVFGNADKGIKQINGFRKLGYKVDAIFVDTNPVKAANNITSRAISMADKLAQKRLRGEKTTDQDYPRTVPLGIIGIPANIDARNVFDQLVNKGLVNRTFLVNNNGGRGEEKVIYRKSKQIEYLNNLPTYNLKEIRKEVQKNVERLYGQGQIPINIYEGLVSGGFN